MAGRLKTGTGSFDPGEENALPLALRSEAERFTSLFGGTVCGVLSGNMGVVDSVRDGAADMFECETADDPGRDTGLEPESRDAENPLENRRSHGRGCASGVSARELPPLSRSMGLSMPKLKLARGVNNRFCPTFAFADRVFPFDPPSPDRAECGGGGGVAKAKGEVRFEGG